MLHIRFSSRHLFVAAALLVAVGLSAPVLAQDEAALRTYFEGRRVTVRIDMPGTSDGVDVYVGALRSIDYKAYGDRLKDYGIAIRVGEPATVTLVKVKKDLVEFQLGGGGFGTFGDDTSPYSNLPPLIEETQREKNLAEDIKKETDSRQKRRLEGELRDLQAERERRNRRIQAERADMEERNRARIAEQRLRGGSRFNVRFRPEVPKNVSPEDVVAALREFVDFSGEPMRTADAAPAFDDVPWKGMEREEAEREFGGPVDVSERREGSLTVVTLIFVRPGQRITAEFVEEVLIRYSIASR